MRVISFLYFLLLVYIIAALVFWGLSLNKQNVIIVRNEIDALHSHIDSVAKPEAYKKEYLAIKERENTRKRQYLGEGVTFLAIILIGAMVVYSSIKSSHRLSRQQSNFILSVTHELKSPIAAVKLNLQTLARRKLDESTQMTLIGRSIEEANRLDDLCNNLLLASQMENRHFKSIEEPINLSEIVENSVQAYEQRSKNAFVSKLEDRCLTNGDKLLWKLAINNLLENAVKYSPSDSIITVELYHNDEEIILSVADEGHGVPDNEKGKIFKKFYRIGSESSRKTKGTGLGLYLTSKIIEQHKGSILVRDNSPQGSVFEITVSGLPTDKS